MRIVNKKAAIVDVVSMLVMPVILAYADSPWWVYVSAFCFGIAQRYAALKN